MNFNIRRYLKNLILKIIEIIEKFEYRNLELDENDFNKKIIKEYDVDFEVLTDKGYKKVKKAFKTQPYTIHHLILENDYYIECADNHIVFDMYFNQTFVKELKIGDLIWTDSGLIKVKEINIYPYKVSMYDIMVESDDHRFYTNGILSHNTVTSSIFICWYVLFHTDRNVLIMANKGDTTKELMDKIRAIIENLPFFLKLGMLKKDVMGMKFDNGCRILGQATTKSAAIGFTVHLLYCDEFAHIPPNILDAFWRSVYPTLSSSSISRCIITSTPNGFNKFYEIYSKGEAKENEFVAINIAWWRVPNRDEKWKQREIANLGSVEMFNQEYECLFLSSSNLLLKSDQLKKILDFRLDYEWKELNDFETYEKGQYLDLKWKPDFDVDNLKEKNEFYIMSIDTSEGVGQDSSVISIFNLELMEKKEVKKIKKIDSFTDLIKLNQIGTFESNTIQPDEFAKFIYHLCLECFNLDNLKLIIEANTFGGEVIRNLLNIYGDDNEFEPELIVKFFHRQGASKREFGIKVGNEKSLYCKDVIKYIDNNKIKISDKIHAKQFESFGKTKTGNYAALTGHDDRVMTIVNLTQFFKTLDCAELFEEFLSFKDDEIEELEEVLDSKLRKNERLEEDDYDFLFA